VCTVLEDNQTLSGDIIAVKPEGVFLTNIFSIELKTGYAGASFDKLLRNNKNNEILSFWDQCTGDAVKANKLPLLIYKNGATNWVATSYEFIKAYEEYCGSSIFTLRNLRYDFGKTTIYFFEFNDFFNTVKPEDVKKIYDSRF
jgi:hypothetical protein